MSSTWKDCNCKHQQRFQFYNNLHLKIASEKTHAVHTKTVKPCIAGAERSSLYGIYVIVWIIEKCFHPNVNAILTMTWELDQGKKKTETTAKSEPTV